MQLDVALGCIRHLCSLRLPRTKARLVASKGSDLALLMVVGWGFGSFLAAHGDALAARMQKTGDG